MPCRICSTALATSALREHPDDPADGEPLQRGDQRRPLDQAAAYRDLAGVPQQRAQRPAEHLLLHQEGDRPRQHPVEQRPVDERGVVHREQHRAHRRELAGDRRAGQDPGQDEPDPPGDPQLVGPDLGDRGHVPASARVIERSPARSTSSWITSATSIAVVSTCTASSAARSGLCARLLSYVSRRMRSAAVERWSSVPSCRDRRQARASGDAVRKIFSPASGATTVPMSRPSTTTAPPPISSRWAATSSSRTPGAADTGLTAVVTAWERISASTGRPSTSTRWSSGSVVISSRVRAASAVTASLSSGSMPSRSTAQVTARYIAPVSRYRNPSRRARPLATVDFPVPEGPSSAITARRSPGTCSAHTAHIVPSSRYWS